MSRARERFLATLDRASSTPEPGTDGGTPRGDAERITVTATEAQNEFGRVLDQAARDQDVVITRHNVPRAVLLSVGRYRELVGAEATILNTLTEEFDALLARMQTPEVRAGTERGFQAPPEVMGRAAEAAARPGRDG